MSATSPLDRQIQIYQGITSIRGGHVITIRQALQRIKTSKHEGLIERIRASSDPEQRKDLKGKLPCIMFSGTFNTRTDEGIAQHSGIICCDVDEMDRDTALQFKQWVFEKPYVLASFISPSFAGVKFLVKIADPAKHREHFAAIGEDLKEAVDSLGWDEKCVNPARVCYESYDPDILIREDCDTYTRYIETTKENFREFVDSGETFKKLMVWMSNKGEIFASGNRNSFIFKLAGACCRYGIDEDNCFRYITQDVFSSSNEFTAKEARQAIRSAYKKNSKASGTATFEKDILVSRKTQKEVEIDEVPAEFTLGADRSELVFAKDIKQSLFDLYQNGYEKIFGIGVYEIDYHFKLKKGEVTLLTGLGNAGKSTFHKWFLLMHAILYGRKFALFAPEDTPEEEFFNDYIEMLLGANCIPSGPDDTTARPNMGIYNMAIDFISEHFIFVQSKMAKPTPEYIMAQMLEAIVHHKVDGCIIDPWNQLTNDISLFGNREDKYLEVHLGNFNRFAVQNDVFFFIVAHPKSMTKKGEDYPAPDALNVAGGPMWNNKCHNVLTYHRPFANSDPDNNTCEFHARKIKKQKIVGKKGWKEFTFNSDTRRFEFKNTDPMAQALRSRNMSWCFWRNGLVFNSEEQVPF